MYTEAGKQIPGKEKMKKLKALFAGIWEENIRFCGGLAAHGIFPGIRF